MYDAYSTEYSQIFEMVKTDRAFMRDLNINGFGQVPLKPESTGVQYDDMSQGYFTDYIIRTYALAYSISAEAIADNMYSDAAIAGTKRLAFALNNTKETHAANVFNNGFDSSVLMTGGDGQPLFSQVHNTSKGGTYSNMLTSPADLSEVSLEQSIIDIGNMTDDAGLKIKLFARKLVIPMELQFEANRILDSRKQNDTANNAINALNNMGFLTDVQISHYLTDPDAFFVLTNAPEGLKFTSRREDQLSQDRSFETDDLNYKISARFAVGWSDSKGVFGSQGL